MPWETCCKAWTPIQNYNGIMVMNEQDNKVSMFVTRRFTVPTHKVYTLLLSPALARSMPRGFAGRWQWYRLAYRYDIRPVCTNCTSKMHIMACTLCTVLQCKRATLCCE